MGIPRDISGKKFGRLTAICVDHVGPRGLRYWLCRCDCGEYSVKPINDLTGGKVKSCGCLFKEHNKIYKTKHGERDTRLYSIWKNMRQRCENSKRKEFKYYGGKGISVCKAWNEFINFRDWALENGYAPNLTIDRKNSLGDYEPSNCRWITLADQQRNKPNVREELRWIG